MAGLFALLGSGCLLLGWLMPNHYLPWIFFYSDAMAIAGLVLWSAVPVHAAPTRVPGTAAAVAALALLPWLQVLGGTCAFAGEAWVATLMLLAAAQAVCLGFNQARAEDGGRAFMALTAVLIVAGLASVFLCMVQWLRFEESLGVFIANMGETGRPFANLAQPNLMATLLVMAVVATGWRFEQGSIGRIGLLALITILTVGIAFSQSRAGYLSATAVALWIAYRGPGLGLRIRRWHALVWLAMIGVFAAALPVLSRWLGVLGDRDVKLFDNNGRWLIWKQIAEGIVAAPWSGYGWGHTGAAQMAGANRFPGVLATAYAHNIFLDLVAWCGVPLGLALSLALVYWFVSRARAAQSRVPVYAYALALPVAVHSLFEFPFAYAIFLIPMGIAAGVVEAAKSGATARSFTVPRLATAVILVAFGLLGVEIAREYLLAEEDFRIVRFESMRLGKTPEAYVRPKLPLMTQLDALLEGGRANPRPGMAPEAIARLDKVAHLYPWAPLLLRYAMALEATGDVQGAAHEMATIRDLFGERYYVDARAWFDVWREGLASVPAR